MLRNLDNLAKIIMRWKLAEAKNKFSEVVNLALSEGPQEVDRRGDQVVVISKSEYDKLCGKHPDFKTYLLSGPDFEGIDLSRNHSQIREVDL